MAAVAAQSLHHRSIAQLVVTSRYGEDCTRLQKDAVATATVAAPWVQQHTRSLAMQHDLRGQPKTRLRPLIYVYDMDSLFTSKQLQWRHIKDACVSRFYSQCALLSLVVFGLAQCN